MNAPSKNILSWCEVGTVEKTKPVIEYYTFVQIETCFSKHASSFNLSLFVWSRFSDTQFSKKIRSSAIFCMSLRYFAFNLSKDTKIYFLSMSVPNAPWNESILFASYTGFLKILFFRIMSPVSHKKTYLYVSNCRIYEYSVIFIYFQCLCPCWLSQFYTLKKKLGIGCVNIRKFVNSTHTK